MQIRTARDDDWLQIFPIFSEVIAAGQSYLYPENLSSDEAKELWLGQDHVVVAVEESADGEQVLGTATMGPNRPGRGAHISTGGFMVGQQGRGRGVGRALGEYLIAWSKTQGYRGIQFNTVVETNAVAVHLWQSLGFKIIGTVPGAFDHAQLGLVGLHVMFRELPGSSDRAGSDHGEQDSCADKQATKDAI